MWRESSTRGGSVSKLNTKPKAPPAEDPLLPSSLTSAPQPSSRLHIEIPSRVLPVNISRLRSPWRETQGHQKFSRHTPRRTTWYCAVRLAERKTPDMTQARLEAKSCLGSHPSGPGQSRQVLRPVLEAPVGRLQAVRCLPLHLQQCGAEPSRIHACDIVQCDTQHTRLDYIFDSLINAHDTPSRASPARHNSSPAPSHRWPGSQIRPTRRHWTGSSHWSSRRDSSLIAT